MYEITCKASVVHDAFHSPESVLGKPALGSRGTQRGMPLYSGFKRYRAKMTPEKLWRFQNSGVGVLLIVWVSFRFPFASRYLCETWKIVEVGKEMEQYLEGRLSDLGRFSNLLQAIFA